VEDTLRKVGEDGDTAPFFLPQDLDHIQCRAVTKAHILNFAAEFDLIVRGPVVVNVEVFSNCVVVLPGNIFWL
jgi:hypothetical protein